MAEHSPAPWHVTKDKTGRSNVNSSSWIRFANVWTNVESGGGNKTLFKANR